MKSVSQNQKVGAGDKATWVINMERPANQFEVSMSGLGVSASTSHTAHGAGHRNSVVMAWIAILPSLNRHQTGTGRPMPAQAEA